jgi:hypothetical protein
MKDALTIAVAYNLHITFPCFADRDPFILSRLKHAISSTWILFFWTREECLVIPYPLV